MKIKMRIKVKLVYSDGDDEIEGYGKIEGNMIIIFQPSKEWPSLIIPFNNIAYYQFRYEEESDGEG